MASEGGWRAGVEGEANVTAEQIAEARRVIEGVTRNLSMQFDDDLRLWHISAAPDDPSELPEWLCGFIRMQDAEFLIRARAGWTAALDALEAEQKRREATEDNCRREATFRADYLERLAEAEMERDALLGAIRKVAPELAA